MPVVVVDRDPVQIGDGAVGIPLLQLPQLLRHVGDGRVDLAGEEEPLAVRREELRQLAPALRDQLDEEQERDDAGVGLGEVPEVVVRGDLAAEDGVLLAHAVLDVGVPDAVHQRGAAGALDRLRHRAARAHVVDDAAAALLLQDRLGKERGDEVAGDELAGVVDEEAAVGVPVVGDAEVGLLLERLGDDELAVLGQQRVRLVVREAPVRLEVARDGIDSIRRVPAADRSASVEIPTLVGR